METNGWRLFQHSLFRSQFDKLLYEADRLLQTQPDTYKNHKTVKLLARIVQIITEEIPADPAHDRFNQGNTLGSENRLWKRAKFGRYRLFFRYDSNQKVIIYVWVNDENTLRKAGDKNDPYAIFARGLKRGQPPNAIDELLKQSEELNVAEAEEDEPDQAAQ